MVLSRSGHAKVTSGLGKKEQVGTVSGSMGLRTPEQRSRRDDIKALGQAGKSPGSHSWPQMFPFLSVQSARLSSAKHNMARHT